MLMSAARAEVLVIDDEPDLCHLVSEALETDHLTCTILSDCSTIDSLLRHRDFDVIVSDIALPGMTGLDLLHNVNQICPDTKTILMTGQRRSDWARQALQEGAFDYLEKPFDLDTLRQSVSNALRTRTSPSYHADPRQLVERHCELLLDADGIVHYVGDNFTLLMGGSPLAATGTPLQQLLGRPSNTFQKLLHEAGLSRKVVTTLTRLTGQDFLAEIIIEKITLDDAAGYLMRIVDVSPLTGTNRPGCDPAPRLRTKIGHDPLTGLPNHRAFQEELERVRCTCRRYGRSVSVLLLNVDNLRELNVNHGFAAGDGLLIELGYLLRTRVRMADYVARYSGQQMAVIMPETNGPDAFAMAHRLRNALISHTFSAPDFSAHLSISIGLAECQSGFIENQNELLTNAEHALTLARHDPSEPVVLWHSDLSPQPSPPHPDQTTVTADRPQTAAPGPPIDRKLRTAQMSMARSLVAAVEAKDPYTKGQSLNVAEYAEYFARRIGLSEEQIAIIRCGGTLHDVGKIGIPDAILMKPGALTSDEFEQIKKHPVMGGDILGQSSFLAAEAELVRHHHERFDGNGYPDGLAGQKLSLGARILQVADALDTMICARFYKKGYDLDRVVDEMRKNRATQFDPQVAEMAIELITRHSARIRFPAHLNQASWTEEKKPAQAGFESTSETAVSV